MDVIKSTYEKLFTIEFIHLGFNFFHQNLIWENIKIKLDNETKKLFANHRINYKLINNFLICFLEVKQLLPPSPTPVIALKEFSNSRIRFLLFGSSNFFKRTQIVHAGSTQVYQFSNQSNAGTNGFITDQETGVNNPDLKDTGLVGALESCFAVIDIHDNSAMNVNYDLFGADMRLLSPIYRIRFISIP